MVIKYNCTFCLYYDLLSHSSGPTSMPAGRPTPSSHHSEFITFAGGNYRGAPTEPNSYPQEQYGRRQDHGYLPDYGQHPVRGGAQQPAPPTSNGRTQEVPRSAAAVDPEPKPAIKSREELGKLDCNCIQLGSIYIL